MNNYDDYANDRADKHINMMQSQRTGDKRLLDEVVPTQTQPVPVMELDDEYDLRAKLAEAAEAEKTLKRWGLIAAIIIAVIALLLSWHWG